MRDLKDIATKCFNGQNKVSMDVHLDHITIKKHMGIITVKIRMVYTLGGGRWFEMKMRHRNSLIWGLTIRMFVL